tara:strand:- start:208 stop:519 length:312 start_codon:yes stop_codon:yes gene_type:complete
LQQDGLGFERVKPVLVQLDGVGGSSSGDKVTLFVIAVEFSFRLNAVKGAVNGGCSVTKRNVLQCNVGNAFRDSTGGIVLCTRVPTEADLGTDGIAATLGFASG